MCELRPDSMTPLSSKKSQSKLIIQHLVWTKYDLEMWFWMTVKRTVRGAQ